MESHNLHTNEDAQSCVSSAKEQSKSLNAAGKSVIGDSEGIYFKCEAWKQITSGMDLLLQDRKEKKKPLRRKWDALCNVKRLQTHQQLLRVEVGKPCLI